MPGRLIAIGDIHGYASSFAGLLDAVRLGTEDRLVTLGDYVDRGPESARVLDMAIDLADAGVLTPLRGNHEVMMADAFDDPDALATWRMFGGEQTLMSYPSADFDPGIGVVPEAHRRFIQDTCVDYLETEGHIFVHASVDPRVALSDQDRLILHWMRFHAPEPHVSGKVVVCGHTAQKSAEPRSVGHAICIDTWIYGRGVLTALDLTTGQQWQADQQGIVTQGWVADKRVVRPPGVL